MKTIERDQCCKCRWVGTDDEKGRQREKNVDYISYIHVCPNCNHDTFYEATERQYQNYLKRSKK